MQKYKVFLISGGTGFIGSKLVGFLLNSNFKVYVLTRSNKKSEIENLTYIQWDPETKFIGQSISEPDICVIHLAGASVAGKRWSEDYKQEILTSRTQGTSFLWELINNKTFTASYFIGASATGYYGDNLDGQAFVESDAPATDFLATTCVAWEKAVKESNINNIPTCIFRIGMVLGAGGGAVPSFMQTFPLTGIPGSGKQHYPWVHIEDVISAFNFAVKNNLNDTYNLVSPQHATARSIITNLAKATGKFFIALASPEFVIKIVLGKFSTEVLKNVIVSSKKLENIGFQFQFANLEKACNQIIAEIKKTS
jgi:uncharacterized protein